MLVYQKSVLLARELYRQSLAFPREETFSITDQMRRSSRSIGAQIAEAWGKRRYERSFITKMIDADAEQMETQHWILVAASCGYITRERERELRDRCEEVGRMIHGVIENSASFCQKKAPAISVAAVQVRQVKETRAAYEAEPADPAAEFFAADTTEAWLYDTDNFSRITVH